MTAFDFYSVLLSFIVSAGVAALLSGVARLIQESSRVVFSWTHALWMLVIFEFQINMWLKAWSYHSTYSLAPASVLLPMMMAVLVYLSAALVIPQVPPTGEIDLPAFHRGEGPKYIAAVAAIYVAAFTLEIALGEVDRSGHMVPIAPSTIIIRFVLIGACMAAIIWRRSWVPLAVGAFQLVMNTIYLFQLLG